MDGHLENIDEKVESTHTAVIELGKDMEQVLKHLAILNGRQGKTEDEVQEILLIHARQDGASEAARRIRGRDYVVLAAIVGVVPGFATLAVQFFANPA